MDDINLDLQTPKKNKLLGFRSQGEASGHQSPINSFNVSTTSFTHLDSVAINAKSLCHDKFALSVSYNAESLYHDKFALSRSSLFAMKQFLFRYQVSLP